MSCSEYESTLCTFGQFLSGCGANSTGTCQVCPKLSDGMYWTGGKNCEVALCNPGSCSSDQYLEGCGVLGPGQCTYCGPVSMQGAQWRNDTNNRCIMDCGDGYFADAAKICRQCLLTECDAGYVLTSCGGNHPGVCTPCAPLSRGCYIDYGIRMDDLTSCPVAYDNCPP